VASLAATPRRTRVRQSRARRSRSSGEVAGLRATSSRTRAEGSRASRAATSGGAARLAATAARTSGTRSRASRSSTSGGPLAARAARTAISRFGSEAISVGVVGAVSGLPAGSSASPAPKGDVCAPGDARVPAGACGLGWGWVSVSAGVFGLAATRRRTSAAGSWPSRRRTSGGAAGLEPTCARTVASRSRASVLRTARGVDRLAATLRRTRALWSVAIRASSGGGQAGLAATRLRTPPWGSAARRASSSGAVAGLDAASWSGWGRVVGGGSGAREAGIAAMVARAVRSRGVCAGSGAPVRSGRRVPRRADAADGHAGSPATVHHDAHNRAS